MSQQELRPGTLDIVSFPLGTMLPKKSPDDKSGPTHGISFKVRVCIKSCSNGTMRFETIQCVVSKNLFANLPKKVCNQMGGQPGWRWGLRTHL